MNAMNPAALVATAPARPPGASRGPRNAEADGGDADFAERLQQARQRDAQRPAASAARPAPPGQPDEARRAAAAAEGEDTEATEASEATESDDEDTDHGDGTTPLPGSEAWLLALGLPPGTAAAATAAGRKAAPGMAGEASAPGLAIAATRSQGRPGELDAPADGAADGKAPAARAGFAAALQRADAAAMRLDPDEPAPRLTNESSAASAGLAAEEARTAVVAAPNTTPTARAEAAAIGLAHSAPLPAASAAAPAAAPVDAHLAAALDSPQFAPALGHQLGLLVRDGVQEARLHLHPAEMGPVSVQIALDGALARVEFRAEVAATRAALEASLPDLAAALRESGLMLAGGGVFDRRGADPGAQPQPPAEPGSRIDAPARAAAPTSGLPLRGARGVVDLYA